MLTKSKFQKLGFQLEPSGNGVYTVDTVKKYIEILAKLGYTDLYIDISSAFAVENEPYFCYCKGRYSKNELKEIDGYARQWGIRAIPIIQTLAHVNFLFTWKEYACIKDATDTLLVGEERTYRLIENMIATVAECFSSKTIHLGMDEAHNLGTGRYKQLHGEVDRCEIMKEHVDRVLAIAKKYYLHCQMWGDMYMRLAYGGYDGDFLFDKYDKSEEVKKIIPKGVELIYWDYYSTEKEHYTRFIKHFKKITDNIIFAGGAWNWLGFCPDNAYSIKELKAAFEACWEEGIQEVFITTWQDNGADCSIFAVLPTVVAAAEFARGNFDADIIKRKFREVIGSEFDDFMALEMPDKLKTLEKNPQRYLLNPTKYLLYNDPFLGYWDSTINSDDLQIFKQSVERLNDCAHRNKEWKYLFDSIAKLALVLEIKFDLGLRTREAYQKNDRNTLHQLVFEDYPELIKRLRLFYSSYEKRWMKENKSNGFEVQDIRLGGLIKRVVHCRKMLKDYLQNKTGKIEELEECLLDFKGGKWATTFNNYLATVTVNKM